MSRGGFDGAEGRRTAALLEWDSILESVSEQCALEASVAVIRSTHPEGDRRRLEDAWAHFDELQRDGQEPRRLPLTSMVDLEELLDDARMRQGPLDADDIVAVAAAAEVLAECEVHVRENAGRLPRSVALCPRLEGCAGLAATIRSCLDRDGRVLDDASPRLRGLRQQQRAAAARWRDAAQHAMRRARDKGWTTAEELTLRGDRYVLPVHARSRGQVPGIIHDRSATGATLYIEPMAVVEAANELSQARMEVFEEEQRVLLTLHQAVAALREELRAGHRFAVALDVVRARVRWGQAHGGQRPIFDEGRALVLRGYRHFQLERSLDRAGRGEELVPLHLETSDARALLVTGPNAGGKSLLLKSVGTAVLLAQSTLPVPAEAPPRLPVFDAVLLELGDDQSIADALSSFSAHLTHLKAMLEAATAHSLVLLDEVGSGTDPQEGVALGWSVLEEFLERGSRVLATTHYGELKALVEKDERFRHASMEFDPQELRPRFRLQLDTPGSSHALAIAARLGLPERVLARARALVGDAHLRFDELLRSLQRERDAHAAARAEVGQARDQARLRQQDYERRVRQWKAERREKLAQAEKEAAGILRNTRRKVERLLAELRAAGGQEAAREVARRARAEVDSAAAAHESRAQLPEVVEAEPVGEVQPGMRLRHRALGKVGEVVEVRGSQITLEIEGTRVVARRQDLLTPEQSGTVAAPSAPTGGIRAEVAAPPAAELSSVDVRGLDVEDAWMHVDRAIDRCLLHGTRELEVVHGKGTGRLREQLGRRLKRDPRVRRAAVGGDGRYDEGVTLVEC